MIVWQAYSVKCKKALLKQSNICYVSVMKYQFSDLNIHMEILERDNGFQHITPFPELFTT